MVPQKPSQLCEGPTHCGRVSLIYQAQLDPLTIFGSRTLVAFLRDDLSSDAQKHNHKIALDCLRTLSARESTGQHETLILAWGQVAV